MAKFLIQLEVEIKDDEDVDDKEAGIEQILEDAIYDMQDMGDIESGNLVYVAGSILQCE